MVMNRLGILKLIGHITFWVGYLFILVNITQLAFPFAESFVRACSIICMHMIIVYFNIYYVVPRYLELKKYGYFALFVVLAIAIVSAIRFLFIEPFFFAKSNLQELRELNLIYKITFTSFSSIILIIISTIYGLAEKRWLLQKANLQAELKLLREQLNPHFLFNTLNNIYVLAYEKSDNAAPMIMKLSEMMRYAYHDCEAEKVLLEKEIIYIHNFIDLYQLRFEKMRAIEFKIDGTPEGMLIAPLLFNPLLENTIKFADLDENPAGFINIQLNAIIPESIEFILTNSFIKKENLHREGIGLQNLQRRLQLIYPGKHILNISEQNNTFTVKLVIKTT